MKVVATKLPDDVYRALVERARKEGVSISEFVRTAIRAHLGFPPQNPRYAELAEFERRLANLEKRVLDLEIAVAELHLELEAKHQGER